MKCPTKVKVKYFFFRQIKPQRIIIRGSSSGGRKDTPYINMDQHKRMQSTEYGKYVGKSDMLCIRISDFK